MAQHAPDMFDAYQTLMKEGWENWLRQVDPKATPGLDERASVARMLDGIRDYGNWLQSGAAAGGQGWQAPPGFSGAPGFQADTDQFQAWLKATQDWLGQAAPGFHPAQQAEQQELLRASMVYAEHQQRYQRLLAGIQARGMAALQQRFAAGAPADMGSMRALYDTWVEVVEQAYNEAALSPEFRAIYGDLVNAQVNLRGLQQGQFAKIADQLGMPGRADIDALAKALQEVRREIQALKASSAAGAHVAVTPKPAVSKATVKTAAAKKTAVKKAAAVRKKSTAPTKAAAPKKAAARKAIRARH